MGRLPGACSLLRLASPLTAESRPCHIPTGQLPTPQRRFGWFLPCSPLCLGSEWPSGAGIMTASLLPRGSKARGAYRFSVAFTYHCRAHRGVKATPDGVSGEGGIFISRGKQTAID